MFKLVSQTEINWKVLVDVLPDEVKKVLYSKGSTSLFAFIQAVDPEVSNYSLDFVSLCFYFEANDSFIRLMRSKTDLRLQTIGDENSGFVVGTLREWKQFVIEHSRKKDIYSSRKFANLVYSQLLSLDLQSIFNDHSRVELKDNSFYLEAK